jgi:hypothetical protein
MLSDKQNILSEYVRMIVKSDGYLQSMFCCSQGGLGKTTVVMNTIEELGIKDAIYVNAYSTPVELVNILYENNGKTFIFDDTETMFSMGSKVINIFKGVLWAVGNTGKRIVSYHTTSKLLRAPPTFIFNGKLIFLVNKLPNKSDPLISAMMSRSLVYDMKFTRDEIVTMLTEYSKLAYRELTIEERTMLLEYVLENTDNTSEDLSFRTIIKVYDIYRHNKETWKELVKPLLTRNERLVLISKLISESTTIKEAQTKFSEMSGLSRATFFKAKTQLGVQNEL